MVGFARRLSSPSLCDAAADWRGTRQLPSCITTWCTGTKSRSGEVVNCLTVDPFVLIFVCTALLRACIDLFAVTLSPLFDCVTVAIRHRVGGQGADAPGLMLNSLASMAIQVIAVALVFGGGGDGGDGSHVVVDGGDGRCGC